MSIERTLCIIKPDAMLKNLSDKIVAKIEAHGLKIIAQKKMTMTKEEAATFYKVHEHRSFFNEVIEYMASAPIIVQVLEGEDAVLNYRKLMGATNPKDAEIGTLRHEFGASIEENAVHGSDSQENADIEIKLFFSEEELKGK